MAKKIFGKKLGMTRFFVEEGRSVPVTIVKTWPCVVTQKKTTAKDGYEAIQVGFADQKETRVTKPLRGHFKASGNRCFRYLREIRVDDSDAFELGQEIKADIFTIGELVKVSSKSKGRGFAGVVKRWGFSGGKDTHGCRSHRVPGSIGMSATPGRVAKGKKLPGRMGFQRTTIKNIQIVDVRPELDIIALKGAVPGSRGTIVEITGN
ncbi:MAG: 50S ribosomal protein L3 [Deltaproteobacteria bacterium]|nr:50S ribosomal protein L3 [Deltaproteobacteria bacterium]MBW2016248.1 50S ribosomal protein L3 [Deltaproteobacteria bacterium]MBW2130067.1 50S ribosomal protein L3 [Deltaproteobacteria bacterium]MBW2304324.1 50S ribosomal protein L3 [Deltaproteobacteria bacterium]